MDSDTPSPSPGGSSGRAALLALLVALAVAVPALGAGAAGAQTQEAPTVRVVGDTVEAGETTTVRVVLSSAPDGLAGFELELSVGDGATVTGASYADGLGLTTEPAIADDGRTVRLEAADVDQQVQPGATNVTLATVTVRGETDGRVALEAEPLQFDADGGGAIEPAVEVGSLAVGDVATTAAPNTGGTVGDDTGDGAATATDGPPPRSQPGFGIGAVVVAAVALLTLTRRR